MTAPFLIGNSGSRGDDLFIFVVDGCIQRRSFCAPADNKPMKHGHWNQVNLIKIEENKGANISIYKKKKRSRKKKEIDMGEN